MKGKEELAPAEVLHREGTIALAALLQRVPGQADAATVAIAVALMACKRAGLRWQDIYSLLHDAWKRGGGA